VYIFFIVAKINYEKSKRTVFFLILLYLFFFFTDQIFLVQGITISHLFLFPSKRNQKTMNNNE